MNAPVYRDPVPDRTRHLSNRELLVSFYTTPRDIAWVCWSLAREIAQALYSGVWLGPYRGPEHDDYD
jgi:hypothetical protein